MSFEATVTRGVYPDRETAKLAAEEKTVRNLEAAVARSIAARDAAGDTVRYHKGELKEAKARLKALA